MVPQSCIKQSAAIWVANAELPPIPCRIALWAGASCSGLHNIPMNPFVLLAALHRLGWTPADSYLSHIGDQPGMGPDFIDRVDNGIHSHIKAGSTPSQTHAVDVWNLLASPQRATGNGNSGSVAYVNVARESRGMPDTDVVSNTCIRTCKPDVISQDKWLGVTGIADRLWRGQMSRDTATRVVRLATSAYRFIWSEIIQSTGRDISRVCVVDGAFGGKQGVTIREAIDLMTLRHWSDPGFNGFWKLGISRRTKRRSCPAGIELLGCYGPALIKHNKDTPASRTLVDSIQKWTNRRTTSFAGGTVNVSSIGSDSRSSFNGSLNRGFGVDATGDQSLSLSSCVSAWDQSTTEACQAVSMRNHRVCDALEHQLGLACLDGYLAALHWCVVGVYDNVCIMGDIAMYNLAWVKRLRDQPLNSESILGRGGDEIRINISRALATLSSAMRLSAENESVPGLVAPEVDNMLTTVGMVRVRRPVGVFCRCTHQDRCDCWETAVRQAVHLILTIGTSTHTRVDDDPGVATTGCDVPFSDGDAVERPGHHDRCGVGNLQIGSVMESWGQRVGGSYNWTNPHVDARILDSIQSLSMETDNGLFTTRTPPGGDTAAVGPSCNRYVSLFTDALGNLRRVADAEIDVESHRGGPSRPSKSGSVGERCLRVSHTVLDMHEYIEQELPGCVGAVYPGDDLHEIHGLVNYFIRERLKEEMRVLCTDPQCDLPASASTGGTGMPKEVHVSSSIEILCVSVRVLASHIVHIRNMSVLLKWQDAFEHQVRQCSSVTGYISAWLVDNECAKQSDVQASQMPATCRPSSPTSKQGGSPPVPVASTVKTGSYVSAAAKWKHMRCSRPNTRTAPETTSTSCVACTWSPGRVVCRSHQRVRFEHVAHTLATTGSVAVAASLGIGEPVSRRSTNSAVHDIHTQTHTTVPTSHEARGLPTLVHDHDRLVEWTRDTQPSSASALRDPKLVDTDVASLSTTWIQEARPLLLTVSKRFQAVAMDALCQPNMPVSSVLQSVLADAGVPDLSSCNNTYTIHDFPPWVVQAHRALSVEWETKTFLHDTRVKILERELARMALVGFHHVIHLGTPSGFR